MNDRWWVIHEDELSAALHRARAGDNPGIVLLELTANASTEHVEGEV